MKKPHELSQTSENVTIFNYYRTENGGPTVEVKIAPRFSASPDFQPAVKQTFTSHEEAERFMEKFELAMMRQLVKNEFAPSHTERGREFVSAASVDGQPQLVYVLKKGANREMFPTQEFREKFAGSEVNGKISGIDIPARGTRLVMGNDLQYEGMAHSARDAALDAMLIEKKSISAQEALTMFSRTLARNGMTLWKGKNNEYAIPAREDGRRFSTKATEEFSGKTVAFSEGQAGKVHVEVVDYFVGSSPDADKKRKILWESDMDAREILRFSFHVSEAQNSSLHPTDTGPHMDMVLHAVKGDIEQALNPKAVFAPPPLDDRILPTSAKQR